MSHRPPPGNGETRGKARIIFLIASWRYGLAVLAIPAWRAHYLIFGAPGFLVSIVLDRVGGSCYPVSCLCWQVAITARRFG
jgi:hypothetical protein